MSFYWFNPLWKMKIVFKWFVCSISASTCSWAVWLGTQYIINWFFRIQFEHWPPTLSRLSINVHFKPNNPASNTVNNPTGPANYQYVCFNFHFNFLSWLSAWIGRQYKDTTSESLAARIMPSDNPNFIFLGAKL